MTVAPTSGCPAAADPPLEAGIGSLWVDRALWHPLRNLMVEGGPLAGAVPVELGSGARLRVCLADEATLVKFVAAALAALELARGDAERALTGFLTATLAALSVARTELAALGGPPGRAPAARRRLALVEERTTDLARELAAQHAHFRAVVRRLAVERGRHDGAEGADGR